MLPNNGTGTRDPGQAESHVSESTAPCSGSALLWSLGLNTAGFSALRPHICKAEPVNSTSPTGAKPTQSPCPREDCNTLLCAEPTGKPLKKIKPVHTCARFDSKVQDRKQLPLPPAGLALFLMDGSTPHPIPQPGNPSSLHSSQGVLGELAGCTI